MILGGFLTLGAPASQVIVFFPFRFHFFLIPDIQVIVLLENGSVGGFLFPDIPGIVVLKSVLIGGSLSFLIPDNVGDTIVSLDVANLFFLPQ